MSERENLKRHVPRDRGKDMVGELTAIDTEMRNGRKRVIFKNLHENQQKGRAEILAGLDRAMIVGAGMIDMTMAIATELAVVIGAIELATEARVEAGAGAGAGIGIEDGALAEAEAEAEAAIDTLKH